MTNSIYAVISYSFKVDAILFFKYLHDKECRATKHVHTCNISCVVCNSIDGILWCNDRARWL